MLAIMSGKPHAICLGRLRNYWPKNETVECLHENIQQREEETNKLSKTETSSASFSLMEHTLLVVQIVLKLLSGCLARTQRSFLLFDYCFAYCVSHTVMIGGSAHCVKSNSKNHNMVKSQMLTVVIFSGQ